MKRARAFGLWGASVVIAASFVYACSSSSDATGGGGTGGDKDATTGSGNDSGGSLGGDSGNNPGDGSITPKKDAGGDAAAGPCGTSATGASCYQCCDDYSDGGVEAFFGYQDTCLCDTKHCGKATTCKNTYCSATPPADSGAKCDQCIDKNLADDAGDAGCLDLSFDECGANPSCAKGITCVIDSNCNSLP